MKIMNVTKRMRILGFIALIVAVSVATNLTTNLVVHKSENPGFQGNNQLPVAYAKFAHASNAMETDFTVAAELSIHAVVHVKTKSPVRMDQMDQMNGFQNDPFFQYFFGVPKQQRRPKEMPMQEASGSGVIISNDGFIVTNNHVVDGASDIEVTLNDNRTFKAKVIGTDPNTDIALIKIDAKDLPVIIFGNSDKLKVGEWVLAVGNPFNLTSTVTAGIVSAKGRNINIINSQLPLESFIQTDAAVNPGNSGGALVNTHGELIGITTAIASQTGSYAGYAFAVPVSIVQKVVTDIQKYGIVQRAVLGIGIRNITDSIAKAKNLKTMEGVYVYTVMQESAAKKAGVKAGDIINNVNGVNVQTSSELQEQIGRYRPGDKITITVIRDSKEQKLDVELKNQQGSFAVVSPQTSEEVLGGTYKELSDKTKQQLGVESGVEIKTLSKGKLADQGIKPGFIILKINNMPVQTVSDIKDAYNAALNSGDQEKVLLIAGLYPKGKIIFYAINLSD